jgi:hypothetical protein
MPGSFNETSCMLLVSGVTEAVVEEASEDGVTAPVSVFAGGVSFFSSVGVHPIANDIIAIANKAINKRISFLLKN